MTMTVKYIGDNEEVEVPAARAVVKHGASIEVGDALGKALCEQESNWSKTTTKKAKDTE